MPLPRKHSPDGASPDWGCEHLIAAYSPFIYPRKDERLSRPGWLTYRGRFNHVSGHPSAVNRAQDRKSSPVKDQRFTAVPRNQAMMYRTGRPSFLYANFFLAKMPLPSRGGLRSHPMQETNCRAKRYFDPSSVWRACAIIAHIYSNNANHISWDMQ